MVDREIRIQVYPQGLALGAESVRPAMIFRDQAEKDVLPIWLDALDTSLLLTETEGAPLGPRGPHDVTFKIFNSFGIKIKSVYFDEVRGSSQYATVTTLQEKAEGDLRSACIVDVKVRASELMSLVIKSGCLFYTNEEVIEKSKSISFEWMLHSNMDLHMHGETPTARRVEDFH